MSSPLPSQELLEELAGSPAPEADAQRRFAVQALKGELESILTIEGSEKRGWTVWVNAYGAPIACAGAPRERRHYAETDRRALINGLILALLPPTDAVPRLPAAPAPQAPLDTSTSTPPQVSSSGALGAGAASPEDDAPRSSDAAEIERLARECDAVDSLQAELDAAVLAVAHAVNEVADEVETTDACVHFVGTDERISVMPSDAWGRITEALHVWKKTTQKVLAALAAQSASPAEPPHEDETARNPPGVRRLREGTSLAMDRALCFVDANGDPHRCVRHEQAIDSMTGRCAAARERRQEPPLPSIVAVGADPETP